MKRMRQAGYSLVEVLAAAMVLALVVMAVAATVRKGRELEVSDAHRRLARALVSAVLERDYDDRDYALITAARSRVYTMTLDARGGAPLNAVVTELVDETPTAVTGDGDVIPLKVVTVKATWTEPDGVADSVEASRWLAETR